AANITVSGTAGAVQGIGISPSGAAEVPAVPGQTVTVAIDVKIAAGSMLRGAYLVAADRDAGGVSLRVVNGPTTTINSTGYTRLFLTYTTGANTVFTSFKIQTDVNSGDVINFTWALRAPQIEFSPSPTSYIQTTGTS